MTTEQDSPRELNELLNLGTYQGMTDEEIQMVIDFKVNAEVTRRITEGKKAALTLQSETVVAQNQESSQRALDVLESILSKRPVLQSVGGENE